MSLIRSEARCKGLTAQVRRSAQLNALFPFMQLPPAQI